MRGYTLACRFPPGTLVLPKAYGVDVHVTSTTSSRGLDEGHWPLLCP